MSEDYIQADAVDDVQKHEEKSSTVRGTKGNRYEQNKSYAKRKPYKRAQAMARYREKKALIALRSAPM